MELEEKPKFHVRVRVVGTGALTTRTGRILVLEEPQNTPVGALQGPAGLCTPGVAALGLRDWSPRLTLGSFPSSLFYNEHMLLVELKQT